MNNEKQNGLDFPASLTNHAYLLAQREIERLREEAAILKGLLKRAAIRLHETQTEFAPMLTDDQVNAEASAAAWQIRMNREWFEALDAAAAREEAQS